MSEKGEIPNISELGKSELSNMVDVLKERESKGYNIITWGGKTSDLEDNVAGGKLCPASSFAVVSEGIFNTVRTNPNAFDDTDSLRRLSQVLIVGSDIYGQASEVDNDGIKKQIKAYVESQGRVFDEKTDWQEFIKTRGERLKTRADAM